MITSYKFSEWLLIYLGSIDLFLLFFYTFCIALKLKLCGIIFLQKLWMKSAYLFNETEPTITIKFIVAYYSIVEYLNQWIHWGTFFNYKLRMNCSIVETLTFTQNRTALKCPTIVLDKIYGFQHHLTYIQNWTIEGNRSPGKCMP